MLENDMRKLTLLVALVPALAFAAPPGPPGRGDDANRGDRAERTQKRMRLARTLGLAEALDLDAADALRLREVMKRFDDRRAPVRKQLRDAAVIVRDSAHGDPAAGAQLDAALQRIRDARAQLLQIDNDMFSELTKGLPPERKARAALFLARFRQHARMAMMRGGPDGAGGPHGPFPRGRGAGPGAPRGASADDPGPQPEEVSAGEIDPELDPEL